MKTLVLLSLSLAVALGMPSFVPGVEKNPVFTEQGDLVPAQGHVVVDDPQPQVSLSSMEQQEKLAPVPVDMEQSESVVQLEVKVKPEAEVEQEGGVKTEVKKDPEVKPEPQVEKDPEVKPEPVVEKDPEVKPEPQVEKDPEVKPEPEVEKDPDVKPEPEVKVEHEVEVGHELKADTEDKLALEANVEPEVNLNPEVTAELVPEVEMESELEDDPDFKVESEFKVELEKETEPEVEPMFDEGQEVQEAFPVQMNLEEETETAGEFEERHIDMERNYEMMGEPIMELEPLDDDDMFGEELNDKELSEVEKSMRAAFQNQDQPLPEEEPIMELEPETEEEHVLHQRVMPDAAIMEEGPALDFMGRPMPPLEEYFPNEEARVGMEPGKQQDTLTVEGSYYLMMGEPGSEFEDSPGGVHTGLVPTKEERALMRQGVENPAEGRSSEQNKQGQCCYPGVVFEGKGYQLFKEPKAAADAEFFCQERFPGGHLGSITSQHIHREVMNMIRQQNGIHRVWVGGLRYLQTGRFIWLDGSHWGYADWLAGEPNNVSDVEDCVEVLAHRNGNFNDFTCWEPQAFICSFPFVQAQ